MPDCASASAPGDGRREPMSAAIAWTLRQQHQASKARQSKSARQTIDYFERAFDQEVHFGFVDNIRRHEVNRVADWPQQQLPFKCGAIKIAAESGIFRLDIERPDHAGHAEVFDARMPGYALCRRGEVCRFRAIALDHAVALE